VTGARQLTLEQLADAAGMTARNVRAYQSRGLLPPPRRDGRTAMYGPEHVSRLRLVRALHHHGLSLRVIGDLLAQEAAEAELARLSREQLLSSWGRPALVPMSTVNVEAFDRAQPGVLDEMVAAGLVVRDGERVLASASGLGLVSALLARGIDLEASSRISLVAAEAAQRSLARLRAEVGDADGEVAGLVVQLAAVAYADVLARRLDLMYP
jgi:DNA-binding transcriptional MerR regulator